MDDEFGVVIKGCTKVTRFFERNNDWLGFDMDAAFAWISLTPDRSLFDAIVTLFNVWILGDVVPGEIRLRTDDEGDVALERIDCLFTVVVLVCVGLRIYVFDVGKPPFVATVVLAEESDDLSAIWNCKLVGGEDLVVGVTKRMEDGVEGFVDGVEFKLDVDDEFRIVVLGLSRCVPSARNKDEMKIRYIWMFPSHTDG